MVFSPIQNTDLNDLSYLTFQDELNSTTEAGLCKLDMMEEVAPMDDRHEMKVRAAFHTDQCKNLCRLQKQEKIEFF